MEFFDSHCHFDFAAFDSDRETVWRGCNAQGIHSLIIPGISPEQWRTAANISAQYDNIYIAVGLHPWWIKTNEVTDDYCVQLKQVLLENIALQNCVAIGECGLDASIEAPLELQQQILDVHLHLAQATQKPLIIHCVKTHNEMLQQLKKYHLPAGGVIHAFSGSYEMAAQYWGIGFRLGIGGTITYERANKTRQAVKQLPLESLLLETDAPDMPLSGKQGQRNSPENIIHIAEALAELRGEPLEYIAQQTTHNAQQLFKIND